MTVNTLGRLLMGMGVLLFLIGVAVTIGARLGLGHLPGDLAWRKGNTFVAIPIVTSLVVSLVLTVVLNLLLRFLR